MWAFDSLIWYWWLNKRVVRRQDRLQPYWVHTEAGKLAQERISVTFVYVIFLQVIGVLAALLSPKQSERVRFLHNLLIGDCCNGSELALHARSRGSIPLLPTLNSPLVYRLHVCMTRKKITGSIPVWTTVVLAFEITNRGMKLKIRRWKSARLRLTLWKDTYMLLCPELVRDSPFKRTATATVGSTPSGSTSRLWKVSYFCD